MATLIQSLKYVLDTKPSDLSNDVKRIILKEILQAYVLEYLYNHAAYRSLNFYGGTCLHVAFELNRLSEDIDLDNQDGIDLTHLQQDLLDFFRKGIGYPDAVASTQQGGAGILRVTLKFPALNALGLSAYPTEALHLKVEISGHDQVALIKHTPVFYHGRSFVLAHFSLETMMAGKMLACLERNFQHGKEGALIKGRDFYDLLWFMQKQVHPLEEKLAKDGRKPYTTRAAMLALQEKVTSIRKKDLVVDLMPLFESPIFVQSWVDAFHANFSETLQAYL